MTKEIKELVKFSETNGARGVHVALLKALVDRGVDNRVLTYSEISKICDEEIDRINQEIKP